MLSDCHTFLVSRQRQTGFTLVELLTVIFIISILAALSKPVIQSLMSAQTIDSDAGILSSSFDQARSYARTHQTYVRAAFSSSGSVTIDGVPATVVVFMSSLDGTMPTAANDSTAMQDSTKWQMIDKPTILRDVCLYDSLNATNPSTSSDLTPNNSDIATSGVSLPIPKIGAVTFNEFVQFAPSGEAGVKRNEPGRYIKIYMDQPRTPNNASVPQGKNPFILRLNGIAGDTNILRSENL